MIFFPQRCFDPTLIRLLKILSRFVVCLHVKDRFFVESCTFVHFRRPTLAPKVAEFLGDLRRLKATLGKFPQNVMRFKAT